MIGIYIRVSTNKQETAAQHKAISSWCSERGYPLEAIAEYCDDAISGRTLERPQFKRLMNDVEGGQIQKIVTFELSRLSRDLVDTMVVMRILARNGVVVEVPGEGVKPFKTAIDQLMTAFHGFAAAQERERISARTKAGLDNARAQGARLGAPVGNRNRLGKLKQHDSRFIDRLVRLSSKLTCREVAAELGVSAATVSRLRRRSLLAGA